MQKETKAPKLWYGRFKQGIDADFERFSASIEFDRKLYHQDITISRVYAQALQKANVITADERALIDDGLTRICSEIEQDNFAWSDTLEDIHTHIEVRLTEMIGEAGKKLHTGRSRNDLVASSMRLYLRTAIDMLDGKLVKLQTNIVEQAQAHTETLMPGYTHLQAAQPICFAHHLLAWFEMLKRDRQRLLDARQRVNVLPLGSAALAGTGYALDRHWMAQQLGFATISDNSIDAVSDRDFAIEFCACAAIIMVHLSRVCEELVLWSSQQFGFIEFPENYATGSSIMPQKKNPDAAELIRGKSARSIASLMALLTLMKSQPLAYNRDNQEDKEALFDSIETAVGCVSILSGVIQGLAINPQRMAQAVQAGYTTATDFADYLVAKGVAFRDAHELVGRCVKQAQAKQCRLSDLDLAWLRSQCASIDDDVFTVLDENAALEARNSYGGTAPSQVREQISRAKKYLAGDNEA